MFLNKPRSATPCVQQHLSSLCKPLQFASNLEVWRMGTEHDGT